jgi:hypothetical protein
MPPRRGKLARQLDPVYYSPSVLIDRGLTASVKPDSQVNGKKRAASSPEAEAPTKRARPASTRSKTASSAAPPSSRKSVRGKPSEDALEPSNAVTGAKKVAAAVKPKNKALAAIKEDVKAGAGRRVSAGGKRVGAPNLGRLPLPTPAGEFRYQSESRKYTDSRALIWIFRASSAGSDCYGIRYR